MSRFSSYLTWDRGNHGKEFELCPQLGIRYIQKKLMGDVLGRGYCQLKSECRDGWTLTSERPSTLPGSSEHNETHFYPLWIKLGQITDKTIGRYNSIRIPNCFSGQEWQMRFSKVKHNINSSNFLHLGEKEQCLFRVSKDLTLWICKGPGIPENLVWVNNEMQLFKKPTL